MSAHGKISFWTAVLMSINIIVGSGIFFGPQLMAKAAGSFSFLVWPMLGLLVFPVIWSVVQASRLFQGDGGFYTYCASGINPFFGFLAQWLYLVGYIGTASVITTVLRDNIINQFGFTLAAQYPYIFNAVVIAFFLGLNLMSIELISKVQGLFTLIKMLPLFLVALVFWGYWDSSITYHAGDIYNLSITFPAAFFAFFGFEACCSLGQYLSGGPRQVGSVILAAFFTVVSLYTLFHFGLIHIMGVDNLTQAGAIAFPEFMGLSPKMTALLGAGITGSILLSFSNTIFGVLLTTITNVFTLAKKKIIIGTEVLSKTNAFDRPTTVAVIQGIILWLLLFFVSSFSVLLALTNLGICSTYLLTVVAVFLTTLKKGDYKNAAVALLGLGSCGLLVYYSWISMGPDTAERLFTSIPLLLGILAGLLLYTGWRKKAAR